MDLAQAVTVLSGEGYGMNPSIFEARIHALRPAAGQEQAATWFRAALKVHPCMQAVRHAQSRTP